MVGMDIRKEVAKSIDIRDFPDYSLLGSYRFPARQSHKTIRRFAERLRGDAEREMRGGRGENIPPVKGRAGGLELISGIGQPNDTSRPLSFQREAQHAIVGPDQMVPF